MAKRNPDVRQRLAEILLRFPDPAKAFRLLQDAPAATKETPLILANAANFLGASRYALRLLDATAPEVKLARPIEVGQILSTNWRDREALAWFPNGGTAADPAPVDGPFGKQQLMLRCYPLLELGRFAEVLAIGAWFLRRDVPAVTTAFASLFSAWALTELDRLREAGRALEQLRRVAPAAGASWPGSLHALVAGIHAARRGDLGAAASLHAKGFAKLFRPGLQPEASWLTCVYWLGWVRHARTGRPPVEWARLLQYPAITPAFRTKIPPECLAAMRVCLTASGLQTEPAPLHLEPSGRLLGPLQLLATLVAAGPYGVPLFRLFDTLWPDEPLSLRSHGKRLEQYVVRLRAMGFAIRWRDNHLYALTGKTVSIGVQTRVHAALPPGLAAAGSFSRADVARALGVSERSATRCCREWLSQELIVRAGCGPQTRYHAAKELPCDPIGGQIT